MATTPSPKLSSSNSSGDIFGQLEKLVHDQQKQQHHARELDTRHPSEVSATSGDNHWEEELAAHEDTQQAKTRERTTSQSSRSINLNTDLDHAAAAIVHPISLYHEKSMEQVMIFLFITCAAVAVLCYFHAHIAWSVGIVSVSSFAVRRRTEGLKDDFLAHMDRRRLEALQHPDSAGESSEWINHILKTIWPILNTDLFGALMDLLEDTIKRESPAIVSGVRLEDLDLGTNALRFLSVKVLPSDAVVGPTIRPDEGDYMALEIEFSYRRLPPPTSQASNSHFVAYFSIGPKRLATLVVPVLVELRGMIGRVRVKFELVSDPPFIRHVFFCFPHVPDMSVVARPLKSTVDLMNVPIFSHIIQKSIRDVLKLFTLPHWYTIDCDKLLVGSDVNLNTQSAGVICIVVHYASDLLGTSVQGKAKSRGYVTIGLARYGKAQYTTRIVSSENGHPHFEEMCIIRVLPDDVEENDVVRFTFWDSDDSNVDDVVGRVEIPLIDVIKTPNQMQRRRHPLAQINRRPKPSGNLTFTIGFFTVNSRDPSKTSTKSGPTPILYNRHGEAVSRAGVYAERIRDALGTLASPDSSLPSGILAIQIHQLAHLSLPPSHKHASHRKHPSHLPPSTYCKIFVNDEKVHQTRLRKLSAAPYINATCEMFCRDFTTAQILIVVMEAKEKEEDVIIGTVASSLADLLQARSQKTLWRPLTGDKASGRLRLSVLFKSVPISIPPPLRGWNNGVLRVSRIRASGLPPAFTGNINIVIDNVYATASSSAISTGGYNCSDDKVSDCLWVLDPPISLPVLRRMQASVLFQMGVSDGSALERPSSGEAVVWLSTIPDGGTWSTYTVPMHVQQVQFRDNNYQGLPSVHASEDYHFSEPNKLRRKSHLQSHSGLFWPDKASLPSPAGKLEIDMVFEHGLSSLHHQCIGPHATEVEEALQVMDARRHDVEGRRGGKVTFSEESEPPSKSRSTPNSAPNSQPSSRRSSWSSMADSSGVDDDGMILGSDEESSIRRATGWLRKRIKRDKHRNEEDVARAKANKWALRLTRRSSEKVKVDENEDEE